MSDYDPYFVQHSSIVRRPTSRALLDAIANLPPNLKPDFYFRFEPNPKSKRIYLEKDWCKLEQRFLDLEGSGWLYYGKNLYFHFEGFLPADPNSDGWYFPDLSLSTHLETDRSIKNEKFRELIEYIPRQFDLYCASTAAADYVREIDSARRAPFVLNPPFADYHPQDSMISANNYAKAKYTFPGLGWITYLSRECVDDYGLDLGELEEMAFSFEEVKDAKSPQPIYRIQLHEHWQDWPGQLDLMIDLHLRADEHRCELGKYMEEIVPKQWHSAQNWPLWIKELQS